jgi:hypothetical protein
MSTSKEGKVEFDDIIGFFVEIEEIGSNISMLPSFVEVLFDHIQELITFTRGGEAGSRSVSQSSKTFNAQS